MTRCDEVRLDFHSYLLGELAPAHAQEVRRHVDGCAGCAAELSRVAEVHRLLSDAPLHHSPAPSLEDDVFALVALEPVGRLASEIPLAPDPPDDLERAALLRAGVLTPRRSRTTTVLVPALGVATVVLGILGVNWRSEAGRAREDAEPFAQTVQLVQLDGSPEPEDSTVELVRYGDSAYKVVLDGSVPPAPDGYYYEMWMSAPDGSRVSCGTFNAGDANTVHDFPVGVDPAEYPYLEISLEPDDGNEEMNGTVQWEGELSLVGSP